jgi:hypothetical protein
MAETPARGHAPAMSDAPSDSTPPSPERPASTPPDTAARATHELAEAADHVRNAANILLERAASDASLRNAAQEAERVLQKVGATAEPLARSLFGELSKIGRQVVEAVEGPRKTESAPPPRDDADDANTRGGGNPPR